MSRIRPAFLVVGAVLLLPAAFWGALKAANTILEHRYPAPGKLVTVGSGHLHLYCIGAGSPTVVIEPGLGTDWSSWWVVATGMAQSQRVCVYDRAGYGWSDAGPLPRTAARVTEELHELLVNGAVPGPYLLVAHSFGARVARLYANRFPESVSGVVLVEPAYEKERELSAESARQAPPPSSGSLLPPLGLARLKRMYQGEAMLPAQMKKAPEAFRRRSIFWSPVRQLEAEQNEMASATESDAEVQAAPFPPKVPLTVLTASRGQDPRVHIMMQARLAGLSPMGHQVVSDSKSHFLHVERPELVLETIRDMIRQSSH